MKKIFCYVLATDNGTAPNYAPPCLTLTLCKPQIRKSAVPGDLVIAFAGGSLDRNPDAVIWAGVVTESLSLANYWQDARFQAKKGRPPQVLDNIYEPDPRSPDGYYQHLHAWHDASSYKRDVSGRNALIFGGPDVWVFRNAPRVLPTEFGLSMGSARRGHQTNYIDDQRWQDLRAWFTGGGHVVRPTLEPSANQAISRRPAAGRRVMGC